MRVRWVGEWNDWELRTESGQMLLSVYWSRQRAAWRVLRQFDQRRCLNWTTFATMGSADDIKLALLAEYMESQR